MQLEGLKTEYDKLQIKYGAKELTSIYNGGCTDSSKTTCNLLLYNHHYKLQLLEEIA